MAKFDVAPDAVRKLAANHRFAADLVRLAWRELLDTGCVTTKSTRDPGAVLLDEWDPHYRRHLVAWTDSSTAELQQLLQGLAAELAALMDELTRGSGGRPHSG